MMVNPCNTTGNMPMGWHMMLVGQVPLQGGNMLSWPSGHAAASILDLQTLLQLGASGLCLPQQPAGTACSVSQTASQSAPAVRPKPYSKPTAPILPPLSARQHDAAHAQAAVTRKPSADKPLYTGVSRCGARGRWRAQLSTGGRSIHLGSFATEEEAARAWDLAAIAQRGKRAQTNFDLSDYAEVTLGKDATEAITRQKVKELMTKIQARKKAEASDHDGKADAQAPASPAGSAGESSGDDAAAEEKAGPASQKVAYQDVLVGAKKGRGSIDFVLSEAPPSKKPAAPAAKALPSSYASMVQAPASGPVHRLWADDLAAALNRRAQAASAAKPAASAAGSALQQLLALCQLETAGQ